MSLINCALTLTWSNCVLTDVITHAAVPTQGNTPEIPAVNTPIGETFEIKDTTLCLPEVTLSTDINFYSN